MATKNTQPALQPTAVASFKMPTIVLRESGNSRGSNPKAPAELCIARDGVDLAEVRQADGLPACICLLDARNGDYDSKGKLKYSASARGLTLLAFTDGLGEIHTVFAKGKTWRDVGPHIDIQIRYELDEETGETKIIVPDALDRLVALIPFAVEYVSRNSQRIDSLTARQAVKK